MSLKPLFFAGACALLPTFAAAEMLVADAYARAASPLAQSGAAFMALTNTGTADDRLLAAASDVAERVELHTHIMDGDVMRMRAVEGGIPVPAGETVLLQRGGLHVMLIGLRGPLEQGAEIALSLTFETAGAVDLSVPVDNLRMPGQMDHGAGMQHGPAGN